MNEQPVVEFFESCVPPKTTHHSKKIVRIGGFSRLADTPQLQSAKNFWETLFLMHRPEQAFEGPVSLSIELTFPWNTSDTKKSKQNGFIPHPTKPDNSNMAKTIEDCAVRCGFIKNDSMVTCLLVKKFRGDRPGVGIRIENAPNTLRPTIGTADIAKKFEFVEVK